MDLTQQTKDAYQVVQILKTLSVMSPSNQEAKRALTRARTRHADLLGQAATARRAEAEPKARDRVGNRLEK